MKRSSLIQVVSGVFLLASPMAFAQQSKPNVVFILADDMGWADLPTYGNKFNEAPNLDKLVAEGMRFTNAYAAAPVCSPARASILSGQYPARVGVIDWIPGHWRPYEKVIVPKNRTQYLPSEIVTIGEAMKSAGYATGYFGKWHLGEDTEHHPLNQGFDEANVAQGYYNVKFNPPRAHDPSRRHSELLADFGEEFIEKNREKPFFLFLAYWDVHVQLDADRDLIDKYLHKPKVDGYPCNAVYAAMIEHLDRSVGRIMHKLDEAGLSDNTIIVFFSDNGGCTTENKYPGIEDNLMPMIAPSKRGIYKNSPLSYVSTSNAPLRDEKGSVFEGGIREPLIVRWPGKVQSGSVSKAIVSSVDFYPTLLELAGVPNSKDQILDGKSIVPEITGSLYDNERAIFWHYPVYHHDVPAGAVRKGDWKLIENQVTGEETLFNLALDISESTDLKMVFLEKLKELRSLLKNWQKEVNAELPRPNPDFDERRRYEWGLHPNIEKK